MALGNQRGNTLIETAVAIAIVAIVAGAALGAVAMATHAAAGDPVHDALQGAAQREMHVAVDVLKYRGASLTPTSVATTLPMPTGSPLAAQLAIATSKHSGALYVTVTATAGGAGSDEQAIVNATLRSQAPLPGTQIQAPGLVPAPTGAP